MNKLMTIGAASLMCIGVNAAENAQESAKFLDNLYIAPVGVYNIPNVHDKGEWGAGLEVGAALNKYVTLGLLNVSYAGADTWQDAGLLVDETYLKAKATLLSSENKSFNLSFLGSGARNWNTDDWGFGAGLGVGLNITKSISLNADSQVIAWFDGKKSLLNTASLSYQF